MINRVGKMRRLCDNNCSRTMYIHTYNIILHLCTHYTHGGDSCEPVIIIIERKVVSATTRGRAMQTFVNRVTALVFFIYGLFHYYVLIDGDTNCPLALSCGKSYIFFYISARQTLQTICQLKYCFISFV